jgi:general stress protein 26
MDPADPAVRRFLRDSMVARLATLSPKGVPAITPLWFAPAGKQVLMTSRLDGPAARNVRANPDVTIVFHAERRKTPRKVLRVHGHAVLRTDRLAWLRLFRGEIPRYYLALNTIRASLRDPGSLRRRIRYYAERSGGSCVIQVTLDDPQLLPLPGLSLGT